MKIVITDACIFISLHELNLVKSFFQLDLEIHTCLEVFNEISEDQQVALQVFRDSGKLFVHNLTEEDRKIMRTNYSHSSFTVIDQAVLYLASRYQALILGGDGVLHNQAKLKSIECGGLIWILDQLVSAGIINHIHACQCLHQIKGDRFHCSQMESSHEITERLTQWSS